MPSWPAPNLRHPSPRNKIGSSMTSTRIRDKIYAIEFSSVRKTHLRATRFLTTI